MLGVPLFVLRKVEMSLFLDAAKVWLQLIDVSYEITIGRRNKKEIIRLTFQMEDFDHLSGIQYAKDIDFRLPRKKYRGDQLIPALLNNKIAANQIEKSEKWGDIKTRLQAIICLQKLLDTDFDIYEFNPNKLRFHTSIKAAYCIYSKELDCGIFLFIDKTSGRFYCKSIFQKDGRNFTENQTAWTVLKKDRCQNGMQVNLFTKDTYKAES